MRTKENNKKALGIAKQEMPRRSVGYEALIKAAHQVFYERGKSGTIEAIGRNAGLSQQLVYHHFGKDQERSAKEVLYDTVLENSVRHIMSLMLVGVPKMPKNAKSTNPKHRQLAVEGIAQLIRNLVTAAGNSSDPYEIQTLMICIREFYSIHDDWVKKVKDPIRATISYMRHCLLILFPDLKHNSISLSLIGTLYTGCLYWERLACGLLRALRRTDISDETRCRFYVASILRMLGLDREFPYDHKYGPIETTRNIFYISADIPVSIEHPFGPPSGATDQEQPVFV